MAEAGEEGELLAASSPGELGPGDLGAEGEAAGSREDRLMRALHSGAVGWWDWDVRADRMVGNADLAEAFGLDPERAAQGLPIASFFANVHPQDRELLDDAIRTAIRSGEPLREEYRIEGAGGDLRWVSARGRCLYDADGAATAFPGVVVDVTDRIEAESRLRHMAAGRELAMSAAELGSWDHNPVLGVRTYDSRALRMLGLSPDAQTDVEVYANIHAEDRDRVLAAGRRMLEPGRTGPFREEFRVVDPATGEQRWLKAIGRTEFKDGVCTRFIGVFDDVTAAKVAELHRRLLTNELNHRLKNTLAVVMGVVDATLRQAADTQGARRTVADRLIALSRAQDLLTAENWSAANVSAVVQSVIEGLSLPRERIEIAASPVRLGPKPLQQLAMALHELATNALKYGALSNDTGKVRIGWRLAEVEGVRRFQFEWAERGGPTVTPPTRNGFGGRLIREATGAEFGGPSVLDYRPQGVRWTLDAPYEGLEARGRPDALPLAPPPVE